MALHRDVYWIGKQWAVTGHGIQACDQKQKGKFDIEAGNLWEDGILQKVRGQKWLNVEDFDKALAMARERYPAPSGKTAPPPAKVAPKPEKVSPKPESVAPKPEKILAKPEKILAKPEETLSKPEKALPKQQSAAPKSTKVEFQLRILGVRARFLPQWRVNFRK
jgi:hypothetical protein